MPKLMLPRFLPLLLLFFFFQATCFCQEGNWLNGVWMGEGYVPGSNTKSLQRIIRIESFDGKNFTGTGATVFPKDTTVRIEWKISGVASDGYLLVNTGEVTYQKDPPHSKWIKDCNCGPVLYKISIKNEKLFLEGEVTGCKPLCNGITKVSRKLEEFDSTQQQQIAKLVTPSPATTVIPVATVAEPEPKRYGSTSTQDIGLVKPKAGSAGVAKASITNQSSLVVQPVALPDVYIKMPVGQVVQVTVVKRYLLPAINKINQNARAMRLALRAPVTPKIVESAPVLAQTQPPVAPAKPAVVKPQPTKDTLLVKKAAPARADTAKQPPAVVVAETTKPLAPVVTKKPDALTSRTTALVQTIKTASPDIQVDLYDNGEIDDDTITVYHNGIIAANQQRLSTRAIPLHIKADQAHRLHEFTMVADNLGRIPPNTALMVITTGGKRYELTITSTENKNAKVVFEYTGNQ